MQMIEPEYLIELKLISKTEGVFDRTTGKYIEATPIEETFEGAIFPLNQNDFVKNQNQGYTRDDRKVYTSKELINGQTIIYNNVSYKVDSDLDYDYVDEDFKRYYIKKVGAVSD